MTAATTIEQLLAQAAIRRVLVEYCVGVDRADIARVLAAYHTDAVDHHGTWDGVAHESLAPALKRLAERTTATVHFLGESRFEWVADTARVETPVHAVHELTSSSEPRNVEHLFGRYQDVFRMVGGHWRISERTFVRDLDYVIASADRAYKEGTFLSGARGAADPGAAFQ